ncbi:MAG: hypothetical protein IJ309_02375 [Clostridia bacterium]|nr:hypothetical protein [Clostridia bacterium]
MDQKNNSTIRKAIETYGAEAQLWVAIEEFAELTQAICKFNERRGSIEAIVDEMADCYIMLEQLRIMYGLEGATISNVIDKKIKRLETRLQLNGVIEPIKVTDGDFSFEYGIVTYSHRFSINRALDDYQEKTLNKCIRIGLEHKYKTMACDKLITEIQIVYKDENNELQCLCADLEEYTFKIKHKGDMLFTL